MVVKININIEIKDNHQRVSDIDREIRQLLCDKLEIAVEDTCNGGSGNYYYEGEFVKLQINT